MDPSPKDYSEASPPPSEGIFGALANALHSARRVFSDVFGLFSLEVRRAGLTLMWMVALGAMAAILMVTAWLGLMLALVLWVVSLGVHWTAAIVAVSLANVLAAAISLFVCLTMSRNLLFPATRRQLESPPAGPETT